MTKSPKLSVIIPFRDTPIKLFEACLKSIAEQICDFAYETIAIDDESLNPKPYKELCDKYGVKYHFKKNGGVSTSRNKGIKLAKGEFVLFVDSDDYLAKDYLAKTMTIVEKRGVDILVCGHTVVENNTETPWNPPNLKSGTRDDIVKDLILKNHYYTCAGSIFRHSIAAKHPFHEGMNMGEDTLFAFECCEDAKIAVATPATYYYIKNSSSATKEKSRDAITAKNLALKNFKSNTEMYKYIAKAYPNLQEIIDTALTSKAYDAVSLYLDCGKVSKSDYVAFCKELEKKVNFSALYAQQTDYSSSKKKGMKLLAERNYGGSFRLNRLKNLAKSFRKRI